MEISKNVTKQSFSTGSGRKILKNSLRDYFYLLKSPDFRLLVLKCTGSYSRVFTVFVFNLTAVKSCFQITQLFSVSLSESVHFLTKPGFHRGSTGTKMYELHILHIT